MQGAIIPENIFVICDLVVKNFWDMKNQNITGTSRVFSQYPRKRHRKFSIMGCAGRKADSQSNPLQWLHTQALELQSTAVGLVCSRTEAVPVATEVIVHNHHRKTLQSPSKSRKMALTTICKSLCEGFALYLVHRLSTDLSDHLLKSDIWQEWWLSLHLPGFETSTQNRLQLQNFQFSSHLLQSPEVTAQGREIL